MRRKPLSPVLARYRMSFERPDPDTMLPKICKSDVNMVMQEIPGEYMDLDEFVHRLILLSKVRAGLQQTGEGVSHEDVETEFSKPRGERRWNRP